MTDFNFSTASAVGLYQSVIGFIIVMASANRSRITIVGFKLGRIM